MSPSFFDTALTENYTTHFWSMVFEVFICLSVTGFYFDLITIREHTVISVLFGLLKPVL